MSLEISDPSYAVVYFPRLESIILILIIFLSLDLDFTAPYFSSI